MPFMKPDVWEEEIYKDVECPKKVVIPVNDTVAWRVNPDFNWVYNKMLLCKAQEMEYGPHGLWPRSWPSFSKPITNLWGEGDGNQVFKSKKEADQNYQPGHFWMEIIKGRLTLIDMVVVDGEALWWSQDRAHSGPNETIDYWAIEKPSNLLLNNCINFTDGYLKKYTGMVNFVMKGDKIIECGLKLSTQLAGLCDKDFLDSVVELYYDQDWDWDKSVVGYTIPLYIPNTHLIRNNSDFINEFKNSKDILSIQLIDKNFNSTNEIYNKVVIIQTTSLDDGLEIRKIIKKELVVKKL